MTTAPPPPVAPGPPARPRRRPPRLVIGLLLLSTVPTIAAIARLVDLAGGERTAANHRFVDSPIPVVVHVVGATVFALAGAFQFVPSLRARRRRWHRNVGRVLVPAGVVVALSGLWMTHAYDLPASDNALLGVFRDVAGVSMLVCLLLGAAATRRRAFAAHGAWMARAYAIGLGAGTQVLTNLPWVIVAGTPTPTARAWLMGAGWAINVAVVEVALARRRAAAARSAGIEARSPRSFRERSAVATVVSLVVAFGGYAVAVANRASAADGDYQVLMVLAVVVFAGLMALTHAALAMASPRAANHIDERDREIARAAGRTGGVVLAAGVCGVLVLALAEASYFAIANSLLGAWVAAELVRRGLKLALHRNAR